MQKKLIRLRKIVDTIFIILIILILFRGPIFRSIIQYKSIGVRPSSENIDPKLKTVIDVQCIVKDSTNINSIIESALKFTAKELHFSHNKCSVNPNQLIISHETNCIGYATFFTISLNHLIKKYHFSEVYKVTPHIGLLYLFDFNIHSLTKDPFFKNHDFVMIENTETKLILAIDPTISDYFYIDSVKMKN